MSDLAQQIIADVLESCTAGMDGTTASLARAFPDKITGDIQFAAPEQGTFESLSGRLNLNGPGLLVVLKADRATVVVTIPSASGLLPDWCAKPGADGEGRLATLAQELGMNLLPETWLTHDFQARWVPNLADALNRGSVPPDATAITIAASRGGEAAGALGLIWPVKNPDGLFAVKPPGGASKPLIGRSNVKEQPTLSLNSNDLPAFTRSLLRIKVPVVVTLAEKRQKLSRIVELGPGSIIQFDKSCEEMLDLEVGNRPVAYGEAVKVGDKFGLRITAISLPDERFNPVRPAAATVAGD